MKKFILFLLSPLLISTVFAHSGRTDASGGHNCRVGSCAGSYHYHNGGYSKPSYSNYSTPTYTTTYSCSKYGTMAYSSSDGYCKCFSGYIFGKNILGEKKCISKNDHCDNKYGYGARYNILADTCECGYGKVFQEKKYGTGIECVSCVSKYGLFAEYNSKTKSCQCRNGYIAQDKSFGSGQECVREVAPSPVEPIYSKNSPELIKPNSCNEGFTFYKSECRPDYIVNIPKTKKPTYKRAHRSKNNYLKFRKKKRSSKNNKSINKDNKRRTYRGRSVNRGR